MILKRVCVQIVVSDSKTKRSKISPFLFCCPIIASVKVHRTIICDERLYSRYNFRTYVKFSQPSRTGHFNPYLSNARSYRQLLVFGMSQSPSLLTVITATALMKSLHFAHEKIAVARYKIALIQ